MCKKLMFLISLVLLLGLVGNASAGDVTWTNAYPWSMLWSSAANWDPVGVPGSGDKAIVDSEFVDPLAPAVEPNQGPVVDCNTVVGEIEGPGGSADQTMRVLAGTLTINGRWELASTSAYATALITDDAIVNMGNFRGMEDISGTSKLEIIGDAEVYSNEWEMMENRDGGTCIVHIGEQAYVEANRWVLANDDDSATTIEILVDGDAIVDVDGRFDGIRGEDTVGTVTFAGNSHSEFGIFRDDDLGNDDAMLTITVKENATLLVDERIRFGDDENADVLNIQDNATVECEELRTGDGGSDQGIINISGNATVLVFDGDMFLGDDGGGEINISGGSTTVSDGSVMIPDSDGTASLTMSGGTLDIDSDLKVPGGGAGSGTLDMTGGTITCDKLEVGADGGGTSLQFMDGGLVDTAEFDHVPDYFMDFTAGTLKINGNDQPLYQDIYAEIMAGRISGYGGCGGRGDIHIDQVSVPDHTLVYATSNPYRAWNPSPGCDAVDQPPIVDLSWNKGDDADVHHIWLGTNFDCVNDANLVCWEDAQPDPDTDYTTPVLTLGQTYYWRIEEVDIDHPRVTEGQAWQFTVQANMPVDGGDMEDFDEENPIWETWKDGCGDANGLGSNGTGSCLYVIAESDQAMLYYYDNTGQDYHYGTRDCNYSEATNTFDAPQDWTLYGIEAIEIMFQGDPDNDATALEAMYMVLTDASSGEGVVVYGAKEPEVLGDMQVAEWQQWDIDLAEFGIDLTAVTSIAIGFGDRTNCHDQMGGIGAMLIDDIALYPERCVPKYTPDIYDLNDDCETDMEDVKVIADDYLHEEL